jgi:Patatin-like phospholipase
MVVSFSRDPEEGVDKFYLFRSYDHNEGSSMSEQDFRPMNPGPAHSGSLWEVARATSAAPSYFEAVKFMNRKFLDGGMGANNPGQIAFQEVRRMHAPHSPTLFVSIGTGVKKDIPRKKRDQARELFKIDRTDDIPRKQGLKKWFELGRFMKDFTTDTEATANNIKFVADELKVPHRRFNVPDGLATIPLDDWRPARSGKITLDQITAHTNDYLALQSTQDDITFCARELVARRRKRAMTERWECFATGIEYHCPAEVCLDSAQSRYKKRKELRKHFKCSHPEALKQHPGDLDAFVDAGRILRGPKPKEIQDLVKKFNRASRTGLSNGDLNANSRQMTDRA